MGECDLYCIGAKDWHCRTHRIAWESYPVDPEPHRCPVAEAVAREREAIAALMEDSAGTFSGMSSDTDDKALRSIWYGRAEEASFWAQEVRARGQEPTLRERAEAAGELPTSMLASKEPGDG